MSALLEGIDIVKTFPAERRTVHAVEGVSLAVAPGETVALVGESGCGKTTLARTLTLLHPPEAGEVRFEGQAVSKAALPHFRRQVQMVFQDPWSSLNPRLTVGSIVAEPLVIHRIPDRRDRVARLLDSVGLRPADAERYPHEFSGGQRQRIAIARALAPEPALIVADEPVSALDVSVRSQILNLLADLRERFGLAYLFISHDLGVVRHFADRVAVMYLGRIVEEGPAEALLTDPLHPYTRALVAAAPRVGRGKRRPGKALPGDVPSPLDPPAGCAFHPRCPLAEAACRTAVPALVSQEGGRRCACPVVATA